MLPLRHSAPDRQTLASAFEAAEAAAAVHSGTGTYRFGSPEKGLHFPTSLSQQHSPFCTSRATTSPGQQQQHQPDEAATAAGFLSSMYSPPQTTEGSGMRHAGAAARHGKRHGPSNYRPATTPSNLPTLTRQHHHLPLPRQGSGPPSPSTAPSGASRLGGGRASTGALPAERPPATAASGFQLPWGSATTGRGSFASPLPFAGQHQKSVFATDGRSGSQSPNMLPGVGQMPLPELSHAASGQAPGSSEGGGERGEGGRSAPPRLQLSMDGSDVLMPGEDFLPDPETMSQTMTDRLISLPDVICKGADGGIYIVGLGEVQNRMHRRRLGEKDYKMLQKMRSQALPSADAHAEWKEQSMRRTQQLPQAEPSGVTVGEHGRASPPRTSRRGSVGLLAATPHGVEHNGRGSPREGPGITPEPGMSLPGRASIEFMDETVRSHLQETMTLVENHRDSLASTNFTKSAIAEMERKAKEEERRGKSAAAVEFATRRLVPHKLLSMALMWRLNPGEPESHDYEQDLEDPKGFEQALRRGSRSPRGPGENDFAPDAVGQGEAAKHKSKWAAAGKQLDALNKSLNSLPFLDGWAKQTKRIKDRKKALGAGGVGGGSDEEGGSGWDKLFETTGGSSYVKGTVDHQGANIYVLKCQEIGETPSSKVTSQLKQRVANMAHCKLGRNGAQALRHALMANTVITELNLECNMLDSKALSEVLRGLCTINSLAGVGGAMAAPRTGDHPTLDWLTPKAREFSVRLVPNSVSGAASPPPQHRGSRMGSALPQSGGPGDAMGGVGVSSRSQLSVVVPSSPSRLGGTGPLSLLSPSGPPSPSKTGPGSKPASRAGTAAGGVRGSGAASSAGTAGTAGSVAVAEKGRTMWCNVTSLNLSDNPVGVGGAKVLAAVLDSNETPRQFLSELRLNKCGIPETGGMEIARALSMGNQTLSELYLSNNQVSSETAHLLGVALGRKGCALRLLDLSWNMIKPDGVKAMCTGLARNTSLTTLSMAWNGVEDEGGVYLGQLLEVNSSLLHLDLTNTRIGAATALVIGNGIKVNKTLQVLLLNGNFIGSEGARHLMGAVKVNTSLTYLGLQGSNMTASGANGSSHSFNPLAPDGSYALDLAVTKERVVALQLCEIDRANPGSDMMKNIRLAGRNMSTCKALNWPDTLPVSGLLQFDFVTKRARKELAVIEQRKLQSLLAQLQERNTSDKERLYLVQVLAPFTYFACQQIPAILSCFVMGSEKMEAAALLFTRATDLEEGISELVHGLSERDLHELMTLLGWYAYLRWGNPTGHYEFTLGSAVHHQFVTRLKDVAHEESPDSTNWINIVHDKFSSTDKMPGNFGPPEAWGGVIPNQGTLAFDFVSTRLTPPGTKPRTDYALLEFLVQVIGLEVDPQTGTLIPCPDVSKADYQVSFLRQEVGPHHVLLTCTQLIQIMRCFLCAQHRVEVAVVCYSLLVDRDMFWTVLYSMSAFEQGLTQWRLGPANVFDRSHPTVHYILDLTNPAHEQVMKKLIDIATAQTEYPNMFNMRLGGRKRVMAERNIWGFMTADTMTPFVELDFLGADALECVLGRSKEEVEAMTKGEHTDAITRLGRRMELSRMRNVQAYFNDGSGWTGAAWQGTKPLMAVLMDKPPWLAAHDRLMRMLIRYERTCKNFSSDSYLEDMFDEYSDENNEMDQESFEHCLKSWGATKAEIAHYYVGLFSRHAGPPEPSDPDDGRGGYSRQGSTVASRAMDRQGVDSGPKRGSGAPASPKPSGAPDSPRPPVPAGERSVTSTAGGPPSLVITFKAFVGIVMREAPPEVRAAEAQAQAEAFAAARAAKAAG